MRKRKGKNNLILIFLLVMIAVITVITAYVAYFKTRNSINVSKQNLSENEENIEETTVIDLMSTSIRGSSQSADDSNVAEETQITSSVNIEPHIDSETGVKYITYEDFGAKSDEDYDNYQSIKNAHDYANANNYEVRATLSTYHIYRLTETAPITIQTNTNWNGAQFIIHDEDINDLTTRSWSIFIITSNLSNTTITDAETLSKIEINKNTKKITQLSGYGNCLCIAYNSNKTQFIRSGNNNNVGNSQSDIFRIDNSGNVLNDIQWNFSSVTKITLMPIPDEQITVENGKFVTNLPETKYEQTSGYFNRNIACTRSNTIIKNIEHTVNNNDYIGGPYFGFIKLVNVANVTLQDSKLYSHKYEKASNYDLILEYCSNITIDNVTSNDVEDSHRWGITGTNYTKDVTYKNCTLNRIDAHCGVYNLTVDNCYVGIKGFTLNGAGKLKISNTTRGEGADFITLRSDYGSTWNGNIEITNCIYNGANTYRLISVITIFDSDDTPHDYGYDKVLPNIYIDGLTITKSNSNYPLEYIFYNDKASTGNAEGDLIKAGYTLPTEIVVKNYEINGQKRLKAFYQDTEDTNNINIQIAIPDKSTLTMKDENGKEYSNGELTNKNIILNVPAVTNLTSKIKVNGQAVENNATLTQTGKYEIEVTVTDTAGNTETDNYTINIDKDAPTITGVEAGSIYYDEATPKSQDSDIEDVHLYLDGNIVQGYKINSTITQIGRYDLEVIDTAGNKSTTNFEIKETTINDLKKYTLKDSKYIKGVDSATQVKEFMEESKLSPKVEIYRNNSKLNETETIRTGDILKVKNNQYTIVVTGDISKDGQVNVVDLMQVKRHIVSNSSLTDLETQAADLNSDGKVNIIDTMQLVRIIIGKNK